MKKNKQLNSGFKIRQQSGAALLIGMVVLASVVAFYMMGQFGAVSSKHDRIDNRVEQLGKAKRALIASAVAYIEDHPGEFGFMPCPDQTEAGILPEGEQESICSGNQNESVIGRLPWRTLDLPPLKDNANECFWYAVSGPYKHTNGAGDKTAMLNEDTNGLFQVYDSAGNLIYGANPNERVVAVVLAASLPLAGQDRTPIAETVSCSGHYTVADYLEGDGDIDNASLDTVVNPDSVDRFIRGGTNSDTDANPFNDRLITITRDEIWNAVKRRGDFTDKLQDLTIELANCIKDYGDAGTDRNLPWPGPVALADYRVDVNYSDIDLGAGSVFGRLPNQVDASEAQLATNPPGSGAGNGGTGNNNNNNTNQGGGQGNCGNPPCGQGGGQGSGGNQGGGNTGNGNGGGNQGGGGGGNNGGIPTVPPEGGPACDDCWDQLEDDIEDADDAYDSCIANGDPPGQCKNERDDKYDEALDDYNVCFSANSCTPGTSPPNPGGGSQPKNEGFVFFDPAIDPTDAGYVADPLTCLSSLNGKLWQHWKDHFFYAVSADFSPTSTNVTCNGNCITTTNGNEHAAIVMFSGSRTAGQTRTGPVVSADPVVADDPDDKQNLVNYLDAENDGSNTLYDHTGADADYLICIDEGANPGDPLVVVANCN